MGRRFVPESTIQRRMNAKDARVNREIRKRAAMAEQKEPTREEIAQEYALALMLINRLRTERDELLAALKNTRCDYCGYYRGAPRDEPACVVCAQGVAAIAHAEGRS